MFILSALFIFSIICFLNVLSIYAIFCKLVYNSCYNIIALKKDIIDLINIIFNENEEIYAEF